jgi:hypothetical protein
MVFPSRVDVLQIYHSKQQGELDLSRIPVNIWPLVVFLFYICFQVWHLAPCNLIRNDIVDIVVSADLGFPIPAPPEMSSFLEKSAAPLMAATCILFKD